MSSIFDILGPIMVGPSSSHTAGAVPGSAIQPDNFLDEPVKKAEVYLHGSFAATGRRSWNRQGDHCRSSRNETR